MAAGDSKGGKSRAQSSRARFLATTTLLVLVIVVGVLNLLVMRAKDSPRVTSLEALNKGLEKQLERSANELVGEQVTCKQKLKLSAEAQLKASAELSAKLKAAETKVQSVEGQLSQAKMAKEQTDKDLADVQQSVTELKAYGQKLNDQFANMKDYAEGMNTKYASLVEKLKECQGDLAVVERTASDALAKEGIKHG